MISIKSISCLLMLLFLGLKTNAQESSLSTGGNITGSDGSVAYSVGQVVYTINSSATVRVIQGVQQPFEISIVELTETLEDLNVSVYPNPSSHYLNIAIDEKYSSDMEFELFSLNGNLIKSGKLESEGFIDISELRPSAYLLKIIVGQESKTYKIIKH
ncbi:MAG: T9SS type A sorting domain-containing protein [Crocinitomicaceae bacterium]|nr:T9SS type A sorting domain-containing protein [Crocinitomicaceae bacterium]